MSPKQVMVNTVAVLFVLTLAWVLYQIRSIVVLLILGIIFATAIEPLVNQLRRRGFPRAQAILSVYVVLLMILGLVLYLIMPPLVRQVSALVSDIPNILYNLERQALASDSDFVHTTVAQLIIRAELAWERLRTDPPIEVETAVAVATSVVGVLFTTVTMMFVAFYWMTEKHVIKRLILRLFPSGQRDSAHMVWDQIEARIGGWVRGQLVVCSFIGITSAIGYYFIGLNFWLALGIWAGVTNLIPFIGPFLGGAAAFIIALTESWQTALIVVAFVVIIQQFESAVLVPRVMRNAVGLTPLTVILAVLIGGTLLGVLGAVIAIPLAAAIQVMVQHLLNSRDEVVALESEAAPVEAAPAPGARESGAEAERARPGAGAEPSSLRGRSP